MATVVIQLRTRVRDTAQRNPMTGEWPWDDILNREIYPALKDLFTAAVTIDEAIQLPVFNLSGAAHTLEDEHIRGYLRISHSADCTLTIPAGFASGDWVRGIQSGAGVLTIVAGSGVTINRPETLVMYKQWGSFSLINVGSDVWDFDGDVELI